VRPIDDQPEDGPSLDDDLRGAADSRAESDRLAADFRQAAADLRAEIGSLPKLAASVLPAPRRVDLPPEPVKAAPVPVTLPGSPSEPALAPAERRAASIDPPVQPPVAGPAPKPDREIAPAPLVARRLGPDGTRTDAPEPPAPSADPVSSREKIRPRKKPAAPTADASVPAPVTKERTPARAGKRRPLLRELGNLCVSLGFTGAIAGLAAAFLVIAPWPDDGLDLWAVNRAPAVVIEDRNGVEIAARGARYGEAVSVKDLPPHAVRAFLATEDRRFYEHGGVDIRGTIRALFANLRAGGTSEGGSTITQQLAKNLFLSPEQTYIRKAKEAMLAFWLEGRYSKDEILSLYLNRIYFGAGAYGVESAAKTYFNKSARQVTLAEAAMLAGLPKAPSSLAPTLNPLGARDRANEVIANMRETGEITEFEAREAMRRPPVIVSGAGNPDTGWFFDYVAEKARAIAGAVEYDIVVRTTLDQKLQRDAEAALRAGLTVDAKVAGALQGALIAYDNDGAVRAMVGGRSYLESQFNRATQAARQPGSAFKPIVYAAAFENGVTPRSRFVDGPIDIAGYKPTNYDDKFRGAMSVSEAVARSINTIAVQVSEKVGRPKVIQMARRLGMSSKIPEGEAGIALGGFSATLEELTAAYLPFVNGGKAPTPYAIDAILDGRGKTLYRRTAREPARAFDEKVAKNVTHVLYQVMTRGTGRNAQLPGRQAAGKTGTTDDWRDAWFIGYTAQMTTGVWVGNDDFLPMNKVTGGSLPASIWKNFMLAAHQDLPKKPLDGAYSDIVYSEQGRLLSFYNEIAEGFRRVRRDGDEDRGFTQ
jgi:penicillin-binding protein 1A